MWISGLAEATGVQVATLKYYLREGLLMQGETTSRTRATYDDRHVERVRLIRALLESGIGIAGARRVIEALENPPESRFHLLGIAQGALPLPAQPGEASDEVDAMLRELGWSDSLRNDDLVRALGTTIDNARAAGLHLPIGAVARYAEKTRQIAEVDVDRALEATSMDEALRTVALGTALLDPMLLTLRRLAQQVVAAEALGPDD